VTTVTAPKRTTLFGREGHTPDVSDTAQCASCGWTGAATDLDQSRDGQACPVCGGEQRLHYEDKIVRTECDCFAEARFHLPPSAVGAFDPETLPDVSDRYLKTTFYRITRGFCPYCDGQVRAAAGPALSPDEAPDELSTAEIERARETPQAHFTCTRCDREFGAGLTSVLLFHPAVVSFYYDHGVDVQSEPYWQLKGLATDRERIRGREPFRAAVTYAVDGDRLTAVVDDSLEVLETDR